jgi:hypothetical protein
MLNHSRQTVSTLTLKLTITTADILTSETDST